MKKTRIKTHNMVNVMKLKQREEKRFKPIV